MIQHIFIDIVTPVWLMFIMIGSMVAIPIFVFMSIKEWWDNR